jgi:Uma2 family endonuclease
MATVGETSGIVFERAAVPPLPVCRLSVEQYAEMIRAGIIGEDDPIELLDGWLVPKMTKNPSHILALGLVGDALREAIKKAWSIYFQEPIWLPTSMPEPDVMVVRGGRRRYQERIPRAEDVGLIVEVSDTSLARDRVFKKSLYAQAGIPCYWVVNLVDRRIEEHAEPAGSGDSADYRVRHDYASDSEIPLVLDGQRVAMIPVREMLP